jgi:hypothetical protein
MKVDTSQKIGGLPIKMGRDLLRRMDTSVWSTARIAEELKMNARTCSHRTFEYRMRSYSAFDNDEVE